MAAHTSKWFRRAEAAKKRADEASMKGDGKLAEAYRRVAEASLHLGRVGLERRTTAPRRR